MKKLMISAVALMLATSLCAKEENSSAIAPRHFVFEVYGSIPNVKNTFEEEHPLGKEVAEKWNTFIANYTCVYDIEVGLSGSATEIRKPAVFKAVERADKYIRKAVKEGRMERQAAVGVMTHVLDCANVICFEDNTSEFEDLVRKAKSGQDVVAIFNEVELKTM